MWFYLPGSENLAVLRINMISYDFKGKCKEIQVICINFLATNLRSNNNGSKILKQWILDNKDNMDLVLEMLEKAQIQ